MLYITLILFHFFSSHYLFSPHSRFSLPTLFFSYESYNKFNILGININPPTITEIIAEINTAAAV